MCKTKLTLSCKRLALPGASFGCKVVIFSGYIKKYPLLVLHLSRRIWRNDFLESLILTIIRYFLSSISSVVIFLLSTSQFKNCYQLNHQVNFIECFTHNFFTSSWLKMVAFFGRNQTFCIFCKILWNLLLSKSCLTLSILIC